VTEDKNVHNALTAIHARLGTIEGRVTLIARAEREQILESLGKDIRKKALIGQIYLALDGSRSQRDVFEVLKAAGIETSEMTVSRTMGKMHTESGIIELVSAGGSKIYRKGDESEAVLNLSAKIREWLREEGEVDPAPPPGRRRRKTP
jgi:DNA polymerase III delta prime subunit